MGEREQPDRPSCSQNGHDKTVLVLADLRPPLYLVSHAMNLFGFTS